MTRTSAARYAALADQAARWCDLCGLPVDTALTWQVFSPVGADEAGAEVAGRPAAFAATVVQLATAARRRCDDAAFPNLYLTSGLHDPPNRRRQDTCARVLTLTLDADACDWLSATRPAEYADAAAAKAALHQLEPEPLAELLEEHQGALVGALLRLGIEPSALVRSGYGHYALLALEAAGAGDVAACCEVNQHLVAALNAAAGYGLVDRAATDCGTRVLRLPGAYNVKAPSKPRLCEFLATDGPRYPLAALRELVPRPERPEPVTRPAASPIGDTAPAGPDRLSDLEVARQALKLIPADDYKIWIGVGKALHAVGLDLAEWEAWSATSAKHQAGECSRRWRTFDGADKPDVAVGFLVNRARDFDPGFLTPGYRRGRDQGGPVARQKGAGGPAMPEPDPEADPTPPAPLRDADEVAGPTLEEARAALAELVDRVTATDADARAAILREALTDLDLREALAALADDAADVAACVSELRELVGKDREAGQLVTALSKQVNTEARRRRDQTKAARQQATAVARSTRVAATSSAVSALAEHLRERCEPLYRTLNPATLTLWDKRDRSPFTVPYAAAKAPDEFKAATGLILSDFLDQIAPLPPTEQNPQPTWRGSKAAGEALSDALTVVGREAPVRSAVHELGKGVHFVEAPGARRPVVVSGATPIWHDGSSWCETDLPICPAGLVHHQLGPDALPWLPDLSAPFLRQRPRLDLAECLDLMFKALTAGWRWQEPWAPVLVATYTVYGIIAYAWQRRVYLHVCGASGTGKSRLRDLWFGHFWPHWIRADDATEYALSHAYGAVSAPVVIDEAEDDARTNPHLPKILAAARRSTYGDATKLRGTATGGLREFRFTWPLLILSIDPLAGSEQDANRFLAVSTRKTLGHNTDTALADFWSDQQVDPAELRADLWRHALNRADEFTNTATRLRDTLAMPEGADYRMVEPAHMLLAVAEVAEPGEGSRLFAKIAPALSARATATRSLSQHEELAEMLLHTQWRGGDPPREMTGAYLVGKHRRGCTDYARSGFVVEVDKATGRLELWVNLATIRPTVLSRSPYAERKAEALQQILARHDAYLPPHGKTVKRGGVSVRWQRFDAAKLLPGNPEADEDE